MFDLNPWEEGYKLTDDEGRDITIMLNDDETISIINEYEEYSQ